MLKKEDLINVSMQIILNAGNARQNAADAVQCAREYQFDKAKEYLSQAGKNIELAHVAQTEIIQNSLEEDTEIISLLFVHAQDTLMSIKSEIRLSGMLIDVYEKCSAIEFSGKKE